MANRPGKPVAGFNVGILLRTGFIHSAHGGSPQELQNNFFHILLIGTDIFLVGGGMVLLAGRPYESCGGHCSPFCNGYWGAQR